MSADSLKRLYQDVPSVDCLRCGSCCRRFTPTFGIAEIIPFLNRLSKNPLRDKIKSGINRGMSPGGCGLLGPDKLCSVWTLRPWACRIFGLEVRYGKNMISSYDDVCPGRRSSRLKKSAISLKDFNLLNRSLDRLNQRYYPGPAPFGIRGLTLASWVALYLADNLKDKHLKGLQAALRRNLNIKFPLKPSEGNFNLLQGLERLTRARRFFRARRYAEALLEFTLFRKDNPEDYGAEEALFSSGICLEKMRSLSEAKEIYQAVLLKTLYRDDLFAARAKERIRCLEKFAG